MAATGNAIRIGIVSDIWPDGHWVRVIYPDQKDMVSGWLQVLDWGGGWCPVINQKVLVAYVSGKDANGFVLGGIP